MASSPRKFLILSASAGTGHLRAADALASACRARSEIAEVRNVDALAYTNKLFRDFYSKLYIQLVENAPTFLGWWYDTSDEPWKTDRMRFMLDRLNTGRLIKMIRRFEPDVAICTHFLPSEIISHLNAKGDIRTRLAIVVTDFDMHAMWLSRSFHHYFVALEETKVHLTMLGLPADRITVSGIPVDPAFARPSNRSALRSAFGLHPDLPVLLVSAGALGVGPADHVVRVLNHLEAPAQIIVICGRNEETRNRVANQLQKRPPPPHLNYTVLGYTDQMADWMGAADLLISKPGGLTTAEALARGLPMVIFSPIPGQEERNSDHLLEKGVAIKCNEVTTMAYKIDRLLADPDRLGAMSRAALALARPDAADRIVDTLLAVSDLEPFTVGSDARETMVEAARKR
ncbi:MAG: glycosyltransferase [Candidatus Methylacidiphilales bacterium]